MGTRDVAASKANTEKGPWGTPAIGEWIRDNPQVTLKTFAEAASTSEGLIIHAMNGHAALESLRMAGEKALGDKVLIDVTNPLDMSKGFPPSLFVCNTDSLGEQLQAAFPRLKVVKTLNTMACPVMIHPRSIPGNHTVFLSGNDADAKTRVKILLMEFGWEEKNMMDLGDIVTARGPEMLVGMWIRVMDKIKNPFFNFHVNIAPQ